MRTPPEEFIHIFVNQPEWLTKFLEAVIANENSSPQEPIFNTLLELYLSDDMRSTNTVLDPSTEKQERRQKALALLQNPKVSTLLYFS